MASISLSGLGYPGSHSLYRDKDGIHSTDKETYPFKALVAYPCEVTVTKNAANQIDIEFKEYSNYSTIAVYANVKEEVTSPASSTARKIKLFCFDTNFFGRIQKILHEGGMKSKITIDKEPASYDESTNTFSNVKVKAVGTLFSNGRVMSDIEEHPKATLVTGFSAEYLLGETPLASDCYKFQESSASADLEAGASDEMLYLVMDFDPTKSREEGWKLTLIQPKV